MSSPSPVGRHPVIIVHCDYDRQLGVQLRKNCGRNRSEVETTENANNNYSPPDNYHPRPAAQRTTDRPTINEWWGGASKTKTTTQRKGEVWKSSCFGHHPPLPLASRSWMKDSLYRRVVVAVHYHYLSGRGWRKGQGIGVLFDEKTVNFFVSPSHPSATGTIKKQLVRNLIHLLYKKVHLSCLVSLSLSCPLSESSLTCTRLRAEAGQWMAPDDQGTNDLLSLHPINLKLLFFLNNFFITASLPLPKLRYRLPPSSNSSLASCSSSLTLPVIASFQLIKH